MRVRVELSIEFDAEAWETTYGPNPDPGESRAGMLRRDVREHVLNNVQQSAPFGDGEVQGTVELVHR